MKEQTPIEIERKCIIEMPSEEFLSQGTVKHIIQTYLTAPAGENRRVRRSECGDKVVFTETVKRRISAMSCFEDEREIGEAEYEACLQDARSDSLPVEKTRYVVPYAGHLLEIDVYPFWQDHAILEVELESEETPLTLPPEITVVREVTGEGMYKNTNIAKFLFEHPNGILPVVDK